MAGGVIDGMHITVRDMEAYLQGLAQTGKKPTSQPYTTGGRSLSEPQLINAMRTLGYSPAQIRQTAAGNLSGGSGIGNAFQGFAGAAAALGPELAPLSSATGVLGDLFGGGSDAASAAADLPTSQPTSAYAPDSATPATDATSAPAAADTTTTEANPNLAARALPSLGTGGALTMIWDTIRKELKYAVIWVGLLALGLGLIFEGLSRNGAPVPRPTSLLLAAGE